MLKLVALLAIFVALSSPVFSYECVKGATYDWPNPENCRKYFHCNNGTLENKSCMFLFNFNPAKLECNFWWFVDCNAKPFTPAPTPMPTTPMSTTPTPTTKHPTSESTSHLELEFI